MVDLRKVVCGRECQVRIFGVCNGNFEMSVLVYIWLVGLCGIGIKSLDLIVIIVCFVCYDEIDCRMYFVDVGYVKECVLEGMARMQVIWLKEGVIKV